MEQETLQEAAENFALDKQNENTSKYYIALESFQKGAKWQMERSYSEEEVLEMLSEVRKGSMVTSSINNRTYWDFDIKSEKKWFEQFKNK